MATATPRTTTTTTATTNTTTTTTIPPLSLLRIILPQLPYVFKTALWHTLGLSPTSYKWDLKTELIIKIVRRFLDPRTWGSIALQQAVTLKDHEVRGRMWISKVVLEVPVAENEGEGVVRAVVRAVEGLMEGGSAGGGGGGEGGEGEEGGGGKYGVPSLGNVTAEWTGYRANVDDKCPRPDLSEAQHYERLTEEVSSDVTILFFHGGAMYLCDPATHRPFTAKLAQLTRGRCLSVRYRLAPQHAFPCALLDCFLAYLSLLSPAPGSFHAPVHPSKIVICGDSAGGNLALSLLQLLLHLNRTSPPSSPSPPTIRFHNRDVPLSLPAGVATNSAWTDLTRCLPSSLTNLPYDYLNLPLRRDEIARFPSCALWPTDPYRENLYCDISMLCHPLASPVIAPDWHGSCPLWFCYGEETLLDEGKILAARAAQQDVQVEWEEWEAMPHTFAQILIGSPPAKKCFESWAAFCTAVVAGAAEKENRRKGVETRGARFALKTMVPSEVDVRGLAVMSDEELKRRMRNAAKGNREEYLLLKNETEEKISSKL